MTDELSIPPAPPPYGEGTLPDLASSLLGSLSVAEASNPLGLPETPRACLLIVDGLGWELLRDHPAAAPFLSELARDGYSLSAGFPSTTVTSLASLGTGRPPGEHGMLGYQVAVPGTGRLLNGLRWDSRVDPTAWQPGPTIYERAAAAGLAAVWVGPGAFRKSGLTLAAMRGASYRRADTLGALVDQAGHALRAADRGLVTVYVGSLDQTGHQHGCGSDAWYFQLGHVDKLAEQLASVLPSGTLLYVTADHGMVDIAPGGRVDVDEIGDLRKGVALVGGEPRARHVYAEPGAAADVLAVWRELLGDRAWVVTREEAISNGWFGPVAVGMAERVGDVVAAAAPGAAIIATQAEPLESKLIGMHGSLTPAEELVPLLLHGAL
ncbi:MAG TPA: nucleotide pyrophosphatase/phosphodiesterase family protein [Streptosporangiaceae bacterium]